MELMKPVSHYVAVARGHSPELKQASKGVAEAWARFDRHLNKE